MASFYAELQVVGSTYPVRHCAYEFTQATSERGRVVAKVRHGLVQLTLDVPDDDKLLDWAATPYKPLTGRVIFYDAKGGAALETLAWEEGQCVGYQEEFASGDQNQGAYMCHLTIAAPKLTMQPGAPAAYLAPAPGEHGSPQQGLVDPFVVPLLTPTPVIAPVVETVAEAAAAMVLAPIALILALILGSSTPAGGPGIPQPHLVPIDPNVLRLNTLAAKHATGTLTSDEEAELIALLGKVKGIHIQRLEDLTVSGTYKGQPVGLPGFHYEEITYTRRDRAPYEALRRKFNSSVRGNFMKKISSEPQYLTQLKAAGFDDRALAAMQKGAVPTGWQVHHLLPLDDGGDNSFDNLLLLKNSPYHSAVTYYQQLNVSKLDIGETQQLKWPVYSRGIVYPPKP